MCKKLVFNIHTQSVCHTKIWKIGWKSWWAWCWYDFYCFSKWGARMSNVCFYIKIWHFCGLYTGTSCRSKSKEKPQKSAEILARATGLEPVTYGLTANLIGSKKTPQHRRNQGFFCVGRMYKKQAVYICVNF